MAVKMLNKGKIYKKILVLPDLHAPFLNLAAAQDAARWAKKHKPDLIIQVGDLMDQKAWSRFPKDVDDFSPHQEFEIAMDQMDEIHDLFPKMEVILGNHDKRIMHKAMEAGLTKHVIRELDELFPYKGWNWHLGAKDRLIVNTATGPVYFLHGDEMGGTPAAKSRRLGMNIVQGHTHQASISYMYNELTDQTVWSMEVGNMMDTASKGARYSAANPVGTIEGFGVVGNGIPYFIPKGAVI